MFNTQVSLATQVKGPGTGGAAQYVRQSTLGGPFTVGTIPVGDVVGSVGGSGTVGTLTKWATANTLTNSLVSEAGGVIAVGGGMQFQTAAVYPGPGSVYRSASLGLAAIGVAGSSYDFAVLDPTGNFIILSVPTGTKNVAFSGNVAVSGTLSVPGNSATFGSNVTIAGTLNVTGKTSLTGLQLLTAPFAGSGSVYRDTSLGLVAISATGSSYDFTVMNPAGGAFVLTVPTGTTNVAFGGNVTVSGILSPALTQAMSWATRASGTVYQAASDGFFMGYVLIGGTASSSAPSFLGEVDIKTDAANPPTTIRQSCSFNVSLGSPGTLSMSSNYYIPFCCPVKKGEFYLATPSGGASTLQFTGFWVPLGTAG
jgi:hypothetical protein